MRSAILIDSTFLYFSFQTENLKIMVRKQDPESTKVYRYMNKKFL